MDSLDFHNVGIWGLVSLVQAAYEKGLDQGYEDGMEAAQEMAALYAEECGEQWWQFPVITCRIYT